MRRADVYFGSQKPRGFSFSHVADHPSRGGASRAAYRIHQALARTSDSESKFFWFSADPTDLQADGRRIESNPSVFRRPILNKLWSYLRDCLNPATRRVFDFALSRNESLERRLAQESDTVLVVHWVQPRDVPARSLRRHKGPVALVLHDARFVLGSVHYPKTSGSPSAPLRLSAMEWFTSRVMKALLPRNKITLICPSLWMKEVALAAGWSDASIATIPYPLDSEFWHRERIRKPNHQEDLTRIGFGYSGRHAADRKGADIFAGALLMVSEYLQTTNGRVEIFFFGDATVPPGLQDQQPTLVPRLLGHLGDRELRRVMSQLDLMVIPSRQENLAQIALEAQACETPIIVANKTGLESAVIPGAGWVFDNGSPESLANVLVMALRDPAELRHRGRRARASANAIFSPTAIAQRYVEQFEEEKA